MNKVKTNKRGGFTLIELMLAMTILAFITASVWSSLYSLATTKEKVEKRDDFQQMTRIVLDRINKDLSLAFIIPKDPKRTGFQGKEENITFTTFSHSPINPRFKEAESTLVNYYLERDPDKPSLFMLERRENKRLKDDFTNDGTKALTLLKGIKKLTFEYYDGEKFATWWDHEGIETKQKDQIPRAVKVSLTVLDNFEREHNFYTMVNIPLSRIDPTYFNPPLVSAPTASGSKGSSGKGAGSKSGDKSGSPGSNENPNSGSGQGNQQNQQGTN